MATESNSILVMILILVWGMALGVWLRIAGEALERRLTRAAEPQQQGRSWRCRFRETGLYRALAAFLRRRR